MATHASFGSTTSRFAIAALGLILLLFGASAARILEPEAFGAFHDDTLLVSSAKSLAEDGEYRFASFPGVAVEPKYPPLHPLVLAAVWRLSPEFPGNLAAIYAVGVVSGLAFLLGCFYWLSRREINRSTVLVLTAICAVHPTVAFLSASAMSDIPFAALSIWGAVAADAALGAEAKRRNATWVVACLLTTAAILTRTLGVALLLALCLSWWRARGRRPSLLPVLVPLLATVWWIYHAAAHAAPVPADAAPGYAQSLIFYQSYGRFWLESVTSFGAFVRMAVTNFFALFREAAFLSFQLPKGEVSARWIFLLETILTGWMFIGAMRRYGRAGATVLDWTMWGSAAIGVLWNYQILGRILVGFLPLLLLSVVSEGSRTVEMIRTASKASDGAVRALARFYFVAIGVLLAVSAYSYLRLTPEFYSAALGARSVNGQSRNELFHWFRTSTAPDVTFVATEDVLIYLHTGRRGVRPIAVTTDALYEGGREALDRQLPYIPDTAAAIGASYWVWTVEDYSMEPAKTRGALVEETDRLLAGREVAFESSDGRIRVYRWPGR